jgi:hypothetical protein
MPPDDARVSVSFPRDRIETLLGLSASHTLALRGKDRKEVEEEARRLEEERIRREEEERQRREEELRIAKMMRDEEERRRALEHVRRKLGLEREDADLAEDDEASLARAAHSRQDHYLRMQLLIAKAKKGVRDQSVGIAALTAINEEILAHLEDVDEKRAQRRTQCKLLAKRMDDKKEKNWELEACVQKRRATFLAVHDELLDRRVTHRKLRGKGGTCSLTIKLLKQAIRAVKRDVLAMNLRAKTQVLPSPTATSVF